MITVCRELRGWCDAVAGGIESRPGAERQKRGVCCYGVPVTGLHLYHVVRMEQSWTLAV